MSVIEKYKKVSKELVRHHKRIEREYAKLTNGGSYSDYYSSHLSTPAEIIEYIYANGGGVTEAELKDLGCARFDEILDLLQKGMSRMTLEMSVVNYKGVIDTYYSDLALRIYSKYLNVEVPYNILTPIVHKEPDGTYFLSCQKSDGQYVIDYLARMGDMESAIIAAEDVVNSNRTVNQLKRDLGPKQKKLEKARKQRKALGLFKGKKGRELKKEIEQLEREISLIEKELKLVEHATSELRAIEGVLNKIISKSK